MTRHDGVRWTRLPVVAAAGQKRKVNHDKAYNRDISDSLVSFVRLGSASCSADDGLITTQSRYSVKETIARFEEAVKAKEFLGFMVFTEIDHAAAAKKFGLEMRPRVVIVFGNPKLGTPVMIKTPLLATPTCRRRRWYGKMTRARCGLPITLAQYLGGTMHARHGIRLVRPRHPNLQQL